MRTTLWWSAVPVVLILSACHGKDAGELAEQARTAMAGEVWQVRDTLVDDVLRASGTAEPLRSAVLSTRLMGTVTEVLVEEGEVVAAGRELVRIDSRELDARRAGVEAGLAAAQAVRQEAEVNVQRMRSLYADSAAPKAQLDAAETGLARAEAGVRTAEASAAELAATTAYAAVRAPFTGTIVRRAVDPGAFAAPGAPLLEIEDASRLRVSVAMTPETAGGYRRGDSLTAWIEGAAATATVEGVVPGQGNLSIVNALVPNHDRRFLSGSAASLALSRGHRAVVLVPVAAVVRQGDLTGVHLAPPGSGLRWVRLGPVFGDFVEVSSGLASGDRIIVPATTGREE